MRDGFLSDHQMSNKVSHSESYSEAKDKKQLSK